MKELNAEELGQACGGFSGEKTGIFQFETSNKYFSGKLDPSDPRGSLPHLPSRKFKEDTSPYVTAYKQNNRDTRGFAKPFNASFKSRFLNR